MDGKKLKRYKIIDEDGNVVSIHGFEKDIDECRLAINLVPTKRQMKVKDEIIKFKNFNNQLGGFYFLNTDTSKEGLFSHDIEAQDLCRLIYLSSFLDYSNRHENYICRKDGKYYSKMTKREVAIELSFNQLSRANAFLKKMEDLKIIETVIDEDEKEYVKLNPSFFIKGNTDMEKYIRIYRKTIKILYRSNKQNDHKKIGQIFMLLPYLDTESNILKNPLTKQNLTKEEICEILGLSTEKGNVSRTIKNLTSYVIRVRDKEMPVLKYTKVYGTKEKKYFVLNPGLAYAGDDFGKIEGIFKTYFFEEDEM